MEKNAAGVGLFGVILLTWGLYLGISDVTRVTSAQRLEARVASVQHFHGESTTRYVAGSRRVSTTPAGSITTFTLPNGTECTADGDWGRTGAHHTVYLPHGSDRCFAISPLDFALAGSLTLVGLVMVSSALRQLRARAAADASRAAAERTP